MNNDLPVVTNSNNIVQIIPSPAEKNRSFKGLKAISATNKRSTHNRVRYWIGFRKSTKRALGGGNRRNRSQLDPIISQ